MIKLKKLPKEMSEKFDCKIKEVVIRDQKDIDEYKKVIGYRKARVKRYGKVPSKCVKL
jgi:hypothetical protein